MRVTEEAELELAAQMCERLIQDGLCVYLVTDGINTKVGVTESILQRLRELQTGNPYELEVFERFIFARREDAFAFETRVLNACKKAGLSIANEWVHSRPWYVREIASQTPARGRAA